MLDYQYTLNSGIESAWIIIQDFNRSFVLVSCITMLIVTMRIYAGEPNQWIFVLEDGCPGGYPLTDRV